jgi:putative phage-type endonuclease
MKANIVATTLTLPREEWLQIRRQGIGGSDAGIILGHSPWSTRLNLWKEKKGLLDETPEESEAMVFGRALENVIITEFQNRTGKRVFHVNAVLASRENPFMIANLDGRIVGEPAGFECKTSYSADYWEDGNIPPLYYDQVQHYCHVCGYEAFYVAVLIQGRRLIWTKVERDQAYIDHLITEEAAFWQLVEIGIPPVPTPEEALRQLQLDFPEPKSGLAINLDSDKAERLLAVKRSLESLEAEEEHLRVELLQEMQDAELGLYKGQAGTVKVIWKLADGRVSFDTDRFKKEHPDLWPQYQRQGEAKRAPRFYLNSAA